MKIILILFYLSTFVICEQKLTEIEETTTELCSNGTEDSCEAVNSSEGSTSTATPSEELTNEQTKSPATTKKPKTTTAKSVPKKTTVRNTTGLTKPHPDCSCDTSVSSALTLNVFQQISNVIVVITDTNNYYYTNVVQSNAMLWS